jgi:hypothetical protein
MRRRRFAASFNGTIQQSRDTLIEKSVAASEVANALVLDVIDRGLERRPCILRRIIRSEILLCDIYPTKTTSANKIPARPKVLESYQRRKSQ